MIGNDAGDLLLSSSDRDLFGEWLVIRLVVLLNFFFGLFDGPNLHRSRAQEPETGKLALQIIELFHIRRKKGAIQLLSHERLPRRLEWVEE
jgi:hypothetical protein